MTASSSFVRGSSCLSNSADVPLTSATRTDALAFPLTFGKRWVAVFVAFGEFAEQVLVGAHSQSIHDRLDTWYAPRDYHRLVRFIVFVDPAGEFDYSLVGGADVDRPLTQDRVVTECFEDTILQLFSAVERSTIAIERFFVIVLVELGVIAVVVIVRVRAQLFILFIRGFRGAAEALAELCGKSRNASVLLRDHDAGREARECAERYIKSAG